MIDCHAHLWDPSGGYPWIRPGSPHFTTFTVDDLAASGAGLELSGTILVEASRGDAGEILLLRDLRLRHPDLILGYVGNLNVHADLPPSSFRELMGETRPNGMRLGGASWEATPASARALIPVLADLGAALELNLHVDALRAAAEVAGRHPALTVIVDHLGNPANLLTGDVSGWREQVRRAARVPNVIMKISGLLTQQHGVPHKRVAELAGHAVESFGPDRCVVGSDWPICLPRGSRADSLRLSERGLAGLTADERARVLTATASRVYNLDGAG
ncbi:L-fuconolactonase [Streptosporangium becharense]|uniref:L-fuconolactonase n=1 Tax=Streptosporangium becharense TaxID=1816182 RepID=A0A7W9MDJ7_9ACTN|nr:amidohydrolase family protein [Streptosporangium becharense]MBB2915345.1 L-fuconolactonase [Streptosporangium becharense]MBB5816957.1 L-fuconolactonase [Streptosporangium becharense]